MIYRDLIDTLAFSDGKQHDVGLDDLQFLRALQFEFPNGVLTAGAGTTDATLQEDGLLRTVAKELRLSADGTDHFVESDAIAEYWRRAIMSGSTGVLKSTMPTGAAATDQRVAFVLDLDQLQSGARFAGRIDTVHLDKLKLRVKNGVVETDMVTGGDRPESLTGDLQVVGVWDTNPSGYRGSGRRIGHDRYIVSAATAKAAVIIPSGLLVSQILFVAVKAGVRDADILENVRVKLGENDIQRDLSFEALQSLNVEMYGLELSAGLPPYTGVAVLDFDEDRDMSPAKLLNTEGLKAQSAKAMLTVGAPSGTTYVDVYYYGVDRRGVGGRASIRRRRATMAARRAARARR